MPTITQRYGRTDRRFTTAIPRFALRASGVKTDDVAGVDIAGLDNDGPDNAGLEIDGLDIGGRVLVVRTKKHAQLLLRVSLVKSICNRYSIGGTCQQSNALLMHFKDAQVCDKSSRGCACTRSLL